MTFGAFADLVICYKIDSGILKPSITDDEEMIPYDLR